MRASSSSPKVPLSTGTIATIPSLTSRLRWPSPRGASSRRRICLVTRRSWSAPGASAGRTEGRTRRRTPPGREGFRALLFEGGGREAPFRRDSGKGGQARHGAKGSRGIEGGGGRGDQRRIQEARAD